MRYSLRTLLLLVMLSAVFLGAWQISTGWGILATVFSIPITAAWEIGPKRLARMESVFGPHAWTSDRSR